MHRSVPFDALSAALFSGFDARRAVYVLVDPLTGAPEGWEAESRPCHPLHSGVLGLQAAQAPYLMELEDRHDPLLDRSLALAIEEHEAACAQGIGAYRFSGWLQTHDADGATLARQLTALMHARRANARYLRLADRRVLDLLSDAHRFDLQPPAQALDWSHALQGVSAWAWLTQTLQLRTVHGAVGKNVPRHLPLDAGHWHLLEQAEAINRGLMLWAQALQEDNEAPELPTDAVRQLLQKLATAQQRGLRTPKDCAAYAAEALQYPRFEAVDGLQQEIALALKADQPISPMLQAWRPRWALPAQEQKNGA